MTIEQFIAHEIERDNPAEPARLKPRADALAVTEPVQQLVGDLKRAFIARTSKRYGAFTGTGDTSPLPGWIQDYLAGRIPFLRLSLLFAEHLVEQLNQGAALFDGHLVFTEELDDEMRWLFIFHVQHRPALLINHDLDIIETAYADAAHLGFAARINLTQWQEQGFDKFLSVSRARGDKELEALFIDCLGFADTLDVKQQTDTFLAAVDTYTKQLPDEVAQECRSKVLDYCIEQDKAGEPVAYRELAMQVDDKAPEHFEQFLREQQVSEDETLILDRNKLRRYSRLSGRNNQLAVSFASSLLGNDVEYHPGDESLTLRNLPKSLLRQLKLLQEDS